MERHSGVSLWRQIADRIRVAIADGEFAATGRLPPAFDLADRFGVNRHTVRAALAFLADEGLVETIQGQGTLIRRRKPLTLPIARRTRFSAGVGDQAASAHIEVLDSSVEPLAADIAALLGLAPGDPAIVLDERGVADGWPVSCSTHVFPGTRFAGIAGHIRATGSITRAFAALGLDDYFRASTDIAARHADAAERALLRLSPGAIVLEARALNVDADGRPVQYSRTRFAADRVSLRVAP